MTFPRKQSNNPDSCSIVPSHQRRRTTSTTRGYQRSSMRSSEPCDLLSGNQKISKPTGTLRLRRYRNLSEYQNPEGAPPTGANLPPRFRLPTVDESMASLNALRRKHELAKRRPPDPPRPSAKGKEKATSYTEEDIPKLKQQWHDQYQDILQGTPEELPPLREVNHEINLIDPNKRYTYYLPRCPDAYKGAFYEKLNQYVRANWWEPQTTPQAAPLLCVPKKNNKL